MPLRCAAGSGGTHSGPRPTRHALAAFVSLPSRSPTTPSVISCSMQTRSGIPPGLRRVIPAGPASRWRNSLLSCCRSPSAVRYTGGSAYVVLAGITFLYYLATIEIAQYLAGNRVRLLLTTRALAEQNFRFDTALANMPHGLCMFNEQPPTVGLEQAVLRPLRDCTGSPVTGHQREGDDRAERYPRQSWIGHGRHGCRVLSGG